VTHESYQELVAVTPSVI
nr:major merozoite surface antigen - malaria parasite (Plasmodium falciparum) (strain FcB-1/ Columbia) (fragments) [Plasmodium falciparum]